MLFSAFMMRYIDEDEIAAVRAGEPQKTAV